MTIKFKLSDILPIMFPGLKRKSLCPLYIVDTDVGMYDLSSSTSIDRQLERLAGISDDRKICEFCGGSGTVLAAGENKECPSCDGSGRDNDRDNDTEDEINEWTTQNAKFIRVANEDDDLSLTDVEVERGFIYCSLSLSGVEYLDNFVKEVIEKDGRVIYYDGDTEKIDINKSSGEIIFLEKEDLVKYFETARAMYPKKSEKILILFDRNEDAVTEVIELQGNLSSGSTKISRRR